MKFYRQQTNNNTESYSYSDSKTKTELQSNGAMTEHEQLLQKHIDDLTKQNTLLREETNSLRHQLEVYHTNSADLRAISNQLFLGILISQQGKYHYINEAFETISGYSTAELHTLPDPLSIIHPDDRDFVRHKSLLAKQKITYRPTIINFV